MTCTLVKSCTNYVLKFNSCIFCDFDDKYYIRLYIKTCGGLSSIFVK